MLSGKALGEFYCEDLLYRTFGINAAAPHRPCLGMGATYHCADIKAYRPEEKSVGAGQVLESAYDFQKTRNVVRETADALALELVGKHVVVSRARWC